MMQKTLIALAVGAVTAALAIPAAAEFNVSGRAHLSFDQYDNGAKKKTDLSSNSSRLRFSGNKEVVEGLTAIIQLEQQINFDRRTDNGAGAKGDTFTTRDSFLGFKGDYGMLRLGYFDTPMKKVRSRTDMFGDRIGDARNMTQGTFDQRFQNSVHYQSPSLSGLVFDIQYSTDNRAKDADQVDTINVRESVSTSLSYKIGDFNAIVAYESQGQDKGVKAREGYRVGAFYNFTKGFRLAGFYEHANKYSNDNNVYGLGAYYDIGDYRLRGQYYIAEKAAGVKDSGANMFALGVDRKFGKDLTVYLAYAQTNNDKAASFRVTGGGHGTSVAPAALGKDVNAISLGAIYNFSLM